MSTATPLPRSTRRRDYDASVGQTVFGPTDFLIFDAEDVRVRVRPAGATGFVTLNSGFSVALTAQPAGYATVTLAAGRSEGDTVRVEGARVHGRTTDITRSGAINTALLEREEDKQAVVLQELRRDLDDVDTNAALAARDEAIEARNDVVRRYLGAFDHFPTPGEVGFPFTDGVEAFVYDQPDPLNDGKYVWQAGQWYPANDRPEAFGRAVVVFVDAGIAASGIVPVPGGYVPGLVDVLRKGVDMVIGDDPGTGDLDPDCEASDGLTIVFPAGVLQLNEPVKIVPRRPIAIAGIQASDVMKGGSDVATVLDSKAPLASPNFAGTPTAPNLTGGSAPGQVANKKYVDDVLAAALSPAEALVSSDAPAGTPGQIDVALTGGYRRFRLVVDDIAPVTNNQGLLGRLSLDGGTIFRNGASDYQQAGRRESSDGTGASYAVAGDTSWQLGRGLPSGNTYGSQLEINITPGKAGRPTVISWRFTYTVAGSGVLDHVVDGGKALFNGVPTHVRLIFNSGAIAAGVSWQLYGQRANP